MSRVCFLPVAGAGVGGRILDAPRGDRMHGPLKAGGSRDSAGYDVSLQRAARLRVFPERTAVLLVGSVPGRRQLVHCVRVHGQCLVGHGTQLPLCSAARGAAGGALRVAGRGVCV